jgi:hypothetical protein
MKVDIFVLLALLALLLLASAMLKYRQWQFFSLVFVAICYGFLVSQALFFEKVTVEKLSFLAFLLLGIVYQAWKVYRNYVL